VSAAPLKDDGEGAAAGAVVAPGAEPVTGVALLEELPAGNGVATTAGETAAGEPVAEETAAVVGTEDTAAGDVALVLEAAAELGETCPSVLSPAAEVKLTAVVVIFCPCVVVQEAISKKMSEHCGPKTFPGVGVSKS